MFAAAAANVFPGRCENEKCHFYPTAIRFFPVNSLLAPVNMVPSSDNIEFLFQFLARYSKIFCNFG